MLGFAQAPPDKPVDGSFNRASRASPATTFPALVIDDSGGILPEICGEVADVEYCHPCASLIVRPPSFDALKYPDQLINRTLKLISPPSPQLAAQEGEAVVELEYGPPRRQPTRQNPPDALVS